MINILAKKRALKAQIKKIAKIDQISIIVFLIMIVAFLWRIWQINSLPKGLSLAEIDILSKAADLTKSSWVIQSNDIFNALYLYLMAIIGKIISFNILWLKITQVCLGTATVCLFYFFVKEWFNRQIALFSTLFLATDAFHTAISREIEPAILTPLALIVMLYFMTLALRRGKNRWFALSGIVGALSIYIDKLFIFVPIVFIISMIYADYKNSKAFLSLRTKYLVSLAMFLIFSIPYLFVLPKVFSYLIDAYNPGSVGQYFMNLGSNVWSLVFQSIPGQLYYPGLEPILSPFLAITFICGLIYILLHADRRQFYFLIVLFSMIVISFSLCGKQTPLNFLLLLPLLFIFSSIILDYLLRNWLRTFPFNKTARIFFTFMLSIFVFLTVYYNYEKYFLAWGKNDAIQKQFNQTFEYNKDSK